MTLTFDLTHDLDLRCFKVKFRTSCISGIIGLSDVKRKVSRLVGYWADYITFTFTTPMTLTLEFQGQSLKKPHLINGMANCHGTKRMTHPFMTMILISVTKVGWVDVPDSDRVTSDVGMPSTYLVFKCDICSSVFSAGTKQL